MRRWYDDPYGDPFGGQRGGFPRLLGDRPLGIPRLHTPEGHEACLVEARFGHEDFPVLRQRLNEHYAPAGEDAWNEVVEHGGKPWVRLAVWLQAPSRVNLEACSRESFASFQQMAATLDPPLRKRDIREQAPGALSFAFRLHRKPMLEGRPEANPSASLSALVTAEEQRWLDTPNRLLDGQTPREAVRVAKAVFGVYELLELAVQGGREAGMLAAFDINRVRAELGLGQRWDD